MCNDARKWKKISGGKKFSKVKRRCFNDAQDPIGQDQLKNQIYLLRFSHTRALLFKKKWRETAIFPALQKLTHIGVMPLIKQIFVPHFLPLFSTLIFNPHFLPSFFTLIFTLIFDPHFLPLILTLTFDPHFWSSFLILIFDPYFWPSFLTLIFHPHFWQFERQYWRLDIWDTDYNSDNWEPEFRQSFLPNN